MNRQWLRNDRIELRSPEPEDLELLYKMENDTRLWCIGCSTLPYSRHTLRAYLEQSTQDLYAEGQARFIISLHNGDSAGMIDLANFDPHNSRAEVCIGILDNYRQQGIATEALLLLITYALDFLNLHQLYAYVPSDNDASLQLFKKAGFEVTAQLKEWIRDNAQYKDVFLMQIIKKQAIEQ